MDKLKNIQQIPTVKDNIHESVFRSYHILRYVLKMLERGDSEETIFEVVTMLKSNNSGMVNPTKAVATASSVSTKHCGVKQPI